MPSRHPKKISQLFANPTKYECIMDWNGILFSPEDFGEYEAKDWMEAADTGSVPRYIEFYCTSADAMHKIRNVFQAIGRKTDRTIKTSKQSAKVVRMSYE